MNSLQKRRLLFLLGCVPTRSALVYLAYTATPAFLQMLGLIALGPAFGFWYLYLTGSRKTGVEVFGDRIWWNNLRPFHGFMYLLFAVLALFQIKQAWIVLFADVLMGTGAFLKFHSTYKENPKQNISWV
jgi:hypothetical protein